MSVVRASMRCSMAAQRKAWWSVKVAGQCLAQLGQLDPHPPVSQIGEHPGITLSGDHGVQHRAAGHAVQVADHRVEFDLRVFQRLLQPQLLPRLIVDQAAPIAGDIAQPLDRLGPHQAGPAHASFDDLGQPHGVELVGLRPAGDVLDVSGVEQPTREAFGLEQVEHRLPVAGGRLHCDQRPGRWGRAVCHIAGKGRRSLSDCRASPAQ